MTVVDVAGHPTGGAGRWRNEIQAWLERSGRMDVTLVGTTQRVSAEWLVRREHLGGQARRVAANNVGFFTGTGPRIVLLRNALHFLRSGEVDQLPALPRQLHLQRHIVIAGALRAHVVVVPSSDMAARVTEAVPRLAGRTIVRHHPLTVSCPSVPADAGTYVLYAASPALHKDLLGNVRALANAMDRVGSPLRIRVTAPAPALGSANTLRRVDAVGQQPYAAMGCHLAGAWAVFAPSTIESFGYPVAEARAYGVPVLAVDTNQNREIGGSALVGYDVRSPESLAAAVENAGHLKLSPDPRPFDPDAYFRWLTSL